jgi:hypothetical protein
MNLIADTNVWYDISFGNRDPRVLKSGGNRLVATPISFLEIASGIDEDTLPRRKRAAQAVLSYADEIAEDSESHLLELWNLRSGKIDFPWIDGFRAIAQAPSVDDLQKGIDDLNTKVRRSVDVSIIKAGRTYNWDGFRDEVVDSVDKAVIGYKAARVQGECVHLDKENGQKFAAALRSAEAKRVFLKNTFWRALLAVGQSPREPSDAECSHAEPLLSPYVNAYVEYLIGCATEFAPESNDLGDSECFLYLQDGNALVSSDRRWVGIARKACPSRYYDPENKIPV